MQPCDALSCLFGQAAAAGRVKVEELASDMSDAGQFDGAFLEQGFIAILIVDQQVAAPALQERVRRPGWAV
jgi:hypothetical protein